MLNASQENGTYIKWPNTKMNKIYPTMTPWEFLAPMFVTISKNNIQSFLMRHSGIDMQIIWLTSSVLHLDVFWYLLNGVGAQKNMIKIVIPVFSPFRFYIKTKWNSLQKFRKIFFTRNAKQILFPLITLFCTLNSPPTLGVLWVSLNHPLTHSKQKTADMDFFVASKKIQKNEKQLQLK